ncbi:MAG: hypothetical protein PHZ03_09355 [Syntrophomonas sp.]|nr:hypothetical protein [Syntrophomonas sp.]
MSCVQRILNGLKYMLSILVIIILLYPLLGLIGAGMEAFGELINAEYVKKIAYVLCHPAMIIPVNIGSATIDLIPLLVVVLAGIWGFYRLK